jgi:High potential iron-sulfur protein
MPACNRRVFLIAAAAPAALAAGGAQASLKKVEENEPKALAVGYKHDTTKVDRARYPKHQPTQNCANCLAYAPAKPTDEWGECDLMSDRLVHRDGWCSSYKPIKKKG